MTATRALNAERQRLEMRPYRKDIPEYWSRGSAAAAGQRAAE